MNTQSSIETSSQSLFEEITWLLFSGQLFENIDSYLDSRRYTVKSKWPARQHSIKEEQDTIVIDSFEVENNEKKLVQRLVCHADGTVQIYQLKSISWGYQPSTDEWSSIVTIWESFRWDTKKKWFIWQITSQIVEWIKKKVWKI